MRNNLEVIRQKSKDKAVYTALLTRVNRPLLRNPQLERAPIEVFYLTPSMVVGKYSDVVHFVRFSGFNDLKVDHHEAVWNAHRQFVLPAFK